MRNLITSSILILALVLFCAPAQAQTPIASTTLSGALSASATQLCVASATNVVLPSLSSGKIGSYLLIDKEVLQVRGSVSTTCFNVTRGLQGSKTVAHASGVTVWILGASVSSGDPSRPISSTNFLSSLGAQPNYAPYVQWNSVYVLPPGTTGATTTVTDVAGKIWYSQLNVPSAGIATGACVVNGATVGSDKWIFGLYDAGGNLLANSTTAGTTTSGASLWQCVAFTSPIALTGPQTYFLALQGNGTTDTFTAFASAPSSFGTGSKTGTFGTLATISPPVTFTTAVGPVMSIY